MNMKEIVNQLELCNYECEGGPLKNNVAFIALKVVAEKGLVCSLCTHNTPGIREFDSPCRVCFDHKVWNIDVHSDVCKEMFESSRSL